MELAYINRVNCKEIVLKFLDYKYPSENTKKAYLKDIKAFFQITKGRELDDLIEHDFKVTLNDFKQFINTLQKKKLVNKTINRKIQAVKSFFKYLEGVEEELGLRIKVDNSFFHKVEPLKAQNKIYGTLKYEEVLQMAELAEKTEIKDGKLKKMLFLFALETGLRKEEIRKVKWDMFIEYNDKYYFEVEGKGEKVYQRTISKEFYSQLSDIKSESDYVFPLSNNHIQKLMERMIEQMNIPKMRNIVFHSVRKASVTAYYYMTGKDIIAAQKFAGHESIETTKRYIEAQDYGFMGAMEMRKMLNSDKLESLSNEEFKKLFNENEGLKMQALIALNNLK